MLSLGKVTQLLWDMKIARSWAIATLAATSYDAVANAELLVIEHAFGAMSEVSLGQHKFS